MKGCKKKRRRKSMSMGQAAIMANIFFVCLLPVMLIAGLIPMDPTFIAGVGLISVGGTLMVHAMFGTQRRFFLTWAVIAVISGTYLTLRAANPLVFLGILTLLILTVNTVIPKRKQE